jgi:ABC-type multidrug transport system permease subunit
MKNREIKTDYGNWVSKRLIYVPAVMTAICIGLSFLSLYFVIGVVVFGVLLAYFSNAYYRFSPAGGDIQSKILELIVERVNWSGQGNALDIGAAMAHWP